MEESGAGVRAAEEFIGFNKTPQSSVISIYRAKIRGVLRTVTVVWIKNLMHHTLSISIDVEGGGNSTCKVELKPWPFWSRKGSKSLDVDGKHVEVSWNFRLAKFADGPEPLEGYYVAVVADEEVALLLGDRKKKAYKKTRSRPSPEDATLVSKQENVFGKKSFTARVRLDDGRDHEVVVENSILSSSSAWASVAWEGRDAAAAPEMSVTFDGAFVIHVSNLQWNFRGNVTVWVEQAPVQVMWDVHDWLFRGHGLGHALFIFKPGMPPPPEAEEEDDDEEEHEEPGGGGGGAGKISSGDLERYRSCFAPSSEFCFFLHAWKMD